MPNCEHNKKHKLDGKTALPCCSSWTAEGMGYPEKLLQRDQAIWVVPLTLLVAVVVGIGKDPFISFYALPCLCSWPTLLELPIDADSIHFFFHPLRQPFNNIDLSAVCVQSKNFELQTKILDKSIESPWGHARLLPNLWANFPCPHFRTFNSDIYEYGTSVTCH